MSLIQDALKKVQNERGKINNPSDSEDNNINDFSNQDIPDRSNRKRYIVLGTSLLILIIISFTATFLLKKPVRIKKGNFIIKKRKTNPENKTSLTVKDTNIPEKKQEINKNIKSERLKQALLLKKEKEVEIKKTMSTALKKNKRQIPEPSPKKVKLSAPTEQRVELISEHKKKRSIKTIKKKSDFEKQFIKGKNFYKNKDYNQAASSFKAALKIKKSKNLYLYIYKCYKNTNNLVLLKAYMIDALKYYKDDIFFNRVMGILLFKQKEFFKALSHFDFILKKEETDINALTYKGLCLFHLKNLEDALAIFKIILKLDNSKIESYYYIGLIYDNLKQYRYALDYYTVFKRSMEQNRGMKNNFRHRTWIIKRISLLERSISVK